MIESDSTTTYFNYATFMNCDLFLNQATIKQFLVATTLIGAAFCCLA